MQLYLERVCMNPEPAELLEQLESDELYQQWKHNHPQSYLSHFFCQIQADGTPVTPWEIGFYEQDTEKITVFAPLNTGKEFEVKPADDVFKKKGTAVEKLSMDEVKTTLAEMKARCRDVLAREFPQEQLGNGFLILQQIQQRTVWNFTFITKRLKFVNVKMNALTGNEEQHEQMNLVSANT